MKTKRLARCNVNKKKKKEARYVSLRWRQLLPEEFALVAATRINSHDDKEE